MTLYDYDLGGIPGLGPIINIIDTKSYKALLVQKICIDIASDSYYYNTVTNTV